MKKYTEEELNGLTVKGRDGEKGLTDIADKLKIDTNGLNKTPLIAEILKVQAAKTKEKSSEQTDASKKRAGSDESDADKLTFDGEKGLSEAFRDIESDEQVLSEEDIQEYSENLKNEEVEKDAAETIENLPESAFKSPLQMSDEKSEAFKEMDAKRSDDPADELTPEEFPRVDEEKAAAARYTEDDKQLEKFVDKGLLPDRLTTRAAIQGVAPIEIVRQVAAGWQVPVEQRIAEAELSPDETNGLPQT